MISIEFLTAGKAAFTVSNGSGLHYTFQVKCGKDKYNQGKLIYFVGLLTGSDNTKDYTCIGRLTTDAVFIPSQGANALGHYTKPLAVFSWALKMAQSGKELPTGYAIEHNGHCCRCARMLTEPTSIMTGTGPECRKKMNVR